PKKDAKAITAAGNVVDEWACEYGIPEPVLSDGAKCFQSKLSDLVYDFSDIRRLKTIPFNPQCDGQMVGKNDNNVDYLLGFSSMPKSKIKQVLKNRLKFYFKSVLDNVKTKQESDSQNTREISGKKKTIKAYKLKNQVAATRREAATNTEESDYSPGKLKKETELRMRAENELLNCREKMAKAADIINLNSKTTWRLMEERDEFSDQLKTLKSDKLKMENELDESNEEILLLRKENEQLRKKVQENKDWAEQIDKLIKKF
ncbi:hypothetical protein BpHYR1_003246, partial [Brachionus plicatilis]